MNAVNKIEQHNPIGTDGFEFVEFTAPNAEGIEQLRTLFTQMGFTETAKHRSKEVWLFQQHDINIVLNGSPTGHVREFGEKHGPSACAMAFRVKNASQAAAYAESQGAKLVGSHANFGELNIPCVEGIGGSLLYLVDRYGDKSIYDVDFEYIEGRTPNDNAVGLMCIDHLTHNVRRGQMDVWSGFYERIANFREIRYFDIEGKLTGLFSRAMTAPCGKIRIPINESADDKSQIEEFIREYHGEGIQHIAVGTEDIYASTDAIAACRDASSVAVDRSLSASPTSSTSPQTSSPGTKGGSGRTWYSPRHMRVSAKLTALARTVETWQDPVVRAIETGLTNARSEGYNRIVKHVGRIAFGFRTPENQRRRVRWACTRRSRRVASSRHQCHC